MSSLLVPLFMLASAIGGYCFGNQKAFDQYMDSEKKAKAFWEEVERRGIK